MTSPFAQTSHPRATVTHFPLERVSDAELVAAAGGGNVPAVAVIWDRYSKSVRRLLRCALGPAGNSEELLQDVFVAYLRGAGRIERGLPLRGYLSRVAVRQVTLELRRRKIRRWAMPTLVWQTPDARTLPDDSDGREAVLALYRVLDRLEIRERLAFTLRHIAGMDIDQVAQVLELPEATVRRALGSAHTKLERSLVREPAIAAYIATHRGAHDA